MKVIQNSYHPTHVKSGPQEYREPRQFFKDLAHTRSALRIESERLRAKSSNIIKDFLRKAVAARVYQTMFSEGRDYPRLRIALPRRPKGEFSFKSLAHLNGVSRAYLQEILNEIKAKNKHLTCEGKSLLSDEERNLLSKVVNAKLHFRHQSHFDLSQDTLKIFSSEMLRLRGRSTRAGQTHFGDIDFLRNNDFVFFGIEFSAERSQLPLNTRHSNIDYGVNAYLTDDEFPYAYMTLTDHFGNKVGGIDEQEHKEYFARFPSVGSEVRRHVHGKKERSDVPIFAVKDMKLALGLHLINFLRKCRDNDFREFCLGHDLDDRELDRIINFVFHPEFHVPRMVGTRNFEKVKLREKTLSEAVATGTPSDVAMHLRNKDDAIRAMEYAIIWSREDIAKCILSTFEFTTQDVAKIPSDGDLEELFSDYDIDDRISELLLVNGLLAPKSTSSEIN